MKILRKEDQKRAILASGVSNVEFNKLDQVFSAAGLVEEE
jgi:hypothetical protein